MSDKLRLPEKRFLGKGALEEAFPFIWKNRNKALIITGNSMVKQGFAADLQEKLQLHQVESVIYTGVTSEPTDKMVEQGVALFQSEKCDFLVGFGGGSQLDAAKAIGAMIVHPGKISDYNGKVFEHELPFLVAIPSTAGTGSEATQVTIITDTEHDIKMLLKGSVLMPDVAIVDPAYSRNVPAHVTAWTGLDALTHAVEAYTSKHAFPECDAYALSAIKRIFQNLPLAFKNGDNLAAREQMAIAAYEGGITICNSTVTLVHGMSRPIGAVFHVPHGLSNAMLLKDCLSLAMDGATDRFAVIAREIGAAKATDRDDVAAASFIQALEELLRKLQIPTLAEYGIASEDFKRAIPKMAVDAMASGSPANTRKAVSIADMEQIYHNL